MPDSPVPNRQAAELRSCRAAKLPSSINPHNIRHDYLHQFHRIGSYPLDRTACTTSTRIWHPDLSFGPADTDRCVPFCRSVQDREGMLKSCEQNSAARPATHGCDSLREGRSAVQPYWLNGPRWHSLGWDTLQKFIHLTHSTNRAPACLCCCTRATPVAVRCCDSSKLARWPIVVCWSAIRQVTVP
jgi:hypothetical protein